MQEQPNQPAAIVPQPSDGETEAGEGRDSVEHPAKLLRIAAMIRELLEEVRQGQMDEKGRVRLREMYERAVAELKEILSPDLGEELDALGIPIVEAQTESELRVGQAQLVGWLEGLFHGMQAAMWAQHMAARAQFEEMRRRGLPMGQPRQGDEPSRAGQYL